MATVTLDGNVYSGRYIVQLGPVKPSAGTTYNFEVLVDGLNPQVFTFPDEVTAELKWGEVVAAMR